MDCCGKKLEIPEWDGDGMGPNLICITCPMCFQMWVFGPWVHKLYKVGLPIGENNFE